MSSTLVFFPFFFFKMSALSTARQPLNDLIGYAQLRPNGPGGDAGQISINTSNEEINPRPLPPASIVTSATTSSVTSTAMSNPHASPSSSVTNSPCATSPVTTAGYDTGYPSSLNLSDSENELSQS